MLVKLWFTKNAAPPTHRHKHSYKGCREVSVTSLCSSSLKWWLCREAGASLLTSDTIQTVPGECCLVTLHRQRHGRPNVTLYVQSEPKICITCCKHSKMSKSLGIKKLWQAQDSTGKYSQVQLLRTGTVAS